MLRSKSNREQSKHQGMNIGNPCCCLCFDSGILIDRVSAGLPGSFIDQNPSIVAVQTRIAVT